MLKKGGLQPAFWCTDVGSISVVLSGEWRKRNLFSMWICRGHLCFDFYLNKVTKTMYLSDPEVNSHDYVIFAIKIICFSFVLFCFANRFISSRVY